MFCHILNISFELRTVCLMYLHVQNIFAICNILNMHEVYYHPPKYTVGSILDITVQVGNTEDT